MPNITLPDGSIRHYEQAISVAQVAASIGSGLAKAAIAGKVDGKLVDTSYLIDKDVNLAIVKSSDPEGLEVIRHSCAHLLAQAVKGLYPSAQVTIGPVIEDGFYYDFSFERPFTPEDLEQIEKRMYELSKADLPVSRREISRNEAISYFRSLGEEYKAKIIQDIPENEVLTLYKQGDFEDLCRGPHVAKTGKIQAFKLTKLAGAYWRGNSNNEMLQRIYGTAWPDKEALKEYLYRLEEAEKRDHRKIGKALNLFHFQEEAPGMVFWHPHGWTIYQILQDYMRDCLKRCHYQEIRTPQVVDRILWEKSGHFANFGKEMFFTETENRHYAIKPMSCPCHVQIYNQGIKSYRELPVRFAEFGNCHRCEPSGSLHGLLRVRNLIQDDGHIFCTEEQIQPEISLLLDSINKVYADFGFDTIIYRLATRPEHRVGADEIWDKAEQALANAMNSRGIKWELAEGEGAFYGPKIEFSLRDSIGRIWQCATVQVDFAMPERLEASYIAEDGSKQIPVMIHRAIFGSFERFLGMLIEHYAGKFPAWLAPIQVAILNITDKQTAYCQKLQEILQNSGFRVIFDLRNEKIGFKIREHTLSRVPYLLVIGDREVTSEQVAVRTREGTDLGTMTIEQFIQQLSEDITKLGRNK